MYINGQSAANTLNNSLQGESSTTIETITKHHSNNGVEYTNNSGNGRNLINNSYVYKHIRLDNNQIFYIGVGTGKNYKRAYSKAGRNKYWNNIVNKTDYKIEIIYNNINIYQAYEIEIFLIKLYGRKCYNKDGLLSNISIGGKGGSKGSKITEEHKLAISNKLKGIKFSKERCKNISISKKQYKFTETHKNNISKSLTGRKIPKDISQKGGKTRCKTVFTV